MRCCSLPVPVERHYCDTCGVNLGAVEQQCCLSPHPIKRRYCDTCGTDLDAAGQPLPEDAEIEVILHPEEPVDSDTEIVLHDGSTKRTLVHCSRTVH